VPQISAIMGPCAGGAVYSPAITDFILMVEGTSYMFITGPDVIKTVTHEEVTKEALGGATTHAARAACATSPRPTTHVHRAGARAALVPAVEQHRGPAALQEDATIPTTARIPELDTMVPLDSNKPYDIKEVIQASSTTAPLRDHEHYAKNIVVGFARIGGRRWASWPTSRACSRACSTSTRA
jgi:propionyl-CoA carboxylase beta chain